MIVKDLIEKLQEFREDCPIQFIDEDGNEEEYEIKEIYRDHGEVYIVIPSRDK